MFPALQCSAQRPRLEFLHNHDNYDVVVVDKNYDIDGFNQLSAIALSESPEERTQGIVLDPNEGTIQGGFAQN